MRLIDADAFERAVMFSDDEDLQDVIYRLRDFPTIEPEQKQNKWILCSEKLPKDCERSLYLRNCCGREPGRDQVFRSRGIE